MLGLVRSSAKSGKHFVCHHIDVWERHLKSQGLSNNFLHSTQREDNEDAHSFDESRVLNFTTSNSMVLMSLLLKWSYLKKEQGGFGDLDDKMRSMDFLKRLCKLACHHGDFAITLATNTGLTYDGDIQGNGDVSIVVASDGSLCLREFVSMAVPLTERMASSHSSVRLVLRAPVKSSTQSLVSHLFGVCGRGPELKRS